MSHASMDVQLKQFLREIRKHEEKFNKSELGKTINKAIENAPKIPGYEWVTKLHTDICPKTSQPYETERYSPDINGPDSDTRTYLRCKSCGMHLGITSQNNYFVS